MHPVLKSNRIEVESSQRKSERHAKYRPATDLCGEPAQCKVRIPLPSSDECCSEDM